jgi:hypothetical protein
MLIVKRQGIQDGDHRVLGRTFEVLRLPLRDTQEDWPQSVYRQGVCQITRDELLGSLIACG